MNTPVHRVVFPDEECNYSPIDFTMSPAAILDEFIQKKETAGGFPANPHYLSTSGQEITYHRRMISFPAPNNLYITETNSFLVVFSGNENFFNVFRKMN